MVSQWGIASYRWTAIERTHGDKEWWVNGKRHRLNGPAVEYANGVEEWWVNGEQTINQNQVSKYIKVE